MRLSFKRALLSSAAILSFCAAFFAAQVSYGAAVHTSVAIINYATSNVSSTAYTTISAAAPISTSYLEFCDTSGKVVTLATGAAGSEHDIATSGVSGCVVVPYYVVIGTRMAVSAATPASATTGVGVLSFIP